jgi:hypothetical protein
LSYWLVGDFAQLTLTEKYGCTIFLLNTGVNPLPQVRRVLRVFGLKRIGNISAQSPQRINIPTSRF